MTTPACATCEVAVVAVDATVDPRALSLTLTAQCGHALDRDHALALWRGGLRWSLPVIDGASVLAAERSRQVHDEGFTAEDDASLDPSDLTWAAWCLLDAAASGTPAPEVPKMWPLPADRWKPEHDPLRRLVIAGALIAAEIDRRLGEQRRAGG